MYDVIIIGAGSAGLSALKTIRKYTDNYLIIDKPPHGTTCAAVGCMPSKVLIQESLRYKEVSKYKLDKKTERIKIMKKVRKLRDHFVSYVLKDLDNLGDKFVVGEALFTSPHSIKVNNKEYSFKKAILAVGSRPRKLFESGQDNLIDTNSFFELEELPDEINLVGTGTIGLELGQALRNLDIKVKAYNRRADFVSSRSKKVKEYASQHFTDELNISIGEIPKNFKNDEYVLQCVGRISNLDNLNLESIFGLNINEIFNEIDEATLAWKKFPHIFISGDSNNRNTILHEATIEGKVSALNALETGKTLDKFVPMSVTFTSPQLASIGFYDEIKNPSKNVTSSLQSFENQGRSKIKGFDKGLIELFMNKETEEIIGAELFCADAEYLAHFLSLGMTNNLKKVDYLRTPFYHPTVMEGLKSAIAKL